MEIVINATFLLPIGVMSVGANIHLIVLYICVFILLVSPHTHTPALTVSHITDICTTCERQFGFPDYYTDVGQAARLIIHRTTTLGDSGNA